MPTHNLPCYLFLLFFVLLSSTHASSLLLNEVKYEVQLTLERNTTSNESLPASVDMYSKYGQKFNCYFPVLYNKNDTNEVPKLNNTYVVSLLEVDNRSACLLMRKDWWTYELCPYRHALQFHDNGKQRISEILLGRFDSETDWDKPISLTMKKPFSHKQWYKNGSICDINFRQRSLVVRYVCADVSFPKITRVEEVETCVYHMDVSAPSLCTHPLFATETPPKIEKIVCIPAGLPTASTKEQPNTRPTRNASSLSRETMIRGRLDIFAIMRSRRNRTDHRIVKRLFRKFLRALSDPVPLSSSVGFSDSFALHIQNNWSLPFALSVERSELKRWIREAHIFVVTLQDYLDTVYIPQRAKMHSRLRAIPIIRSLYSLLVELLIYKRDYVSSPYSPLETPLSHQFENAARVLSTICQELSKNLDSNVISCLKKDLQSMYFDPEFSAPPGETTLQAIGVDTGKHVRIRLTTKTRSRFSVTPMEAVELFNVGVLMHRLMNVLKSLQGLLSSLDRLQEVESIFTSTLHNLLSGPQFPVVVVRGMNEVNELDDEPENVETSDNMTPGPALSQNILSMVKKALQGVSPGASENLEIYETENVKGISTVFIVSGEEKRKVEQRIKNLENAYKYIGGNRDFGNEDA